MSVSSTIGEAIEQLGLFFAPLTTRQGILARRALDQQAPGDEALVGRLVERMRAEARPDGSLPGGVVATVWRIHELLDLGCHSDLPECMRALHWMLQLQGRPGAFSQGCTPARHSYRACEHFISSFFSPGPPEQRIAPVMFPNGKVFRAEPAARFAISCMALRAAFRGGMADRPGVERHTTSLVQLQKTWPDSNGYFAPDVVAAGLHALAYTTGAQRAQVEDLASALAATQGEDGAWLNADLFHCLETLLAIGSEEARTVVSRAIPALLARQRADGSFGSTAQQERALIGLRALLWARQDS